MILTQIAPAHIPVAVVPEPFRRDHPRCVDCSTWDGIDAQYEFEYEMRALDGELAAERWPLCAIHLGAELPNLAARHQGITPPVLIVFVHPARTELKDAA